MQELQALVQATLKAGRNLVPLLLVVALYQLLVARQVPEQIGLFLAGLALVAAGIGLFLRGLELGVFPIGRGLAQAFVERGSLPWLLAFGFCLGVATVIAEPALIAVAAKAEMVSEGRVDAWVLRLLVAASVGLAIAVGILRAVLRQPIHWYLGGGYLLLVLVTYLTPAEITGLAYDAGAVSVNMVTVPLVAAIGVGLMASLRGHRALADGFGLIALAVMAPRITVQLYGIVIYAAEPTALVDFGPQGDTTLPAVNGPDTSAALATVLADILSIMANLLPILAVILVFQFLVLRRPLLHGHRLAGGFLLLLLGLFAFTEGLRLGLFPIGAQLAVGLSAPGVAGYLYLFVFLLGFAATLVEPALIAVVQRAGAMDPARLKPLLIRGLVAVGVGVGLLVGALRISAGLPLDHVLVITVALVVLLTLLAPREIRGFAFDLGGIATSDVTVPVIAALGVGLAVALGSENVLLDGFGLVALASLFPVAAVMLYGILVSFPARAGHRKP